MERSAPNDSSPTLPALSLDAIEQGSRLFASAQGLPAVAPDGTVALLVTRSWYNDAFYSELRSVSPQGASTRLVLENVSGEEAYEPQTAVAALALEHAVERGQSFLAKGKFKPLAVHTGGIGPSREFHSISDDPVLVKVGHWWLKYAPTSRVVRILDDAAKPVISRRVGIVKRNYCCSPEPNAVATCVAGYGYFQLWTDDTTIVLRGKAPLGPDGCELDEQIVVFWPKLGKVAIVNN